MIAWGNESARQHPWRWAVGIALMMFGLSLTYLPADYSAAIGTVWLVLGAVKAYFATH